MSAFTIGTIAAPAHASTSAAAVREAPNPQQSQTQQPQDLVVSDDPAGFTPHVLDGQVLAVAVVGNKVVLGGDFTRAQNASGGAVMTRNRILAFDRTTGVIDTSFVPVLDGTVRSLTPSADGLSVYVGGQFNSVSGVSAYKIARISMATGKSVAGFNAGLVSALVYDVKLVGTRLFIAGQFTKVAGQDRSLLAELDPVTGALRPGAGPVFAGTHNGGTTHIYKFDVNPDGQTLAAIGNFTTVGGQPRVQAVMLDIAGTPTLSDWQSIRYEPLCYSVFQYYVRDIEFSPDGEYFVISSTGGYGSGPPTLCDTATRWDADERGQGVDPEWVAYTGGDSSYAVALTGTAIYIGGHQRWWNNPFAADAAGQGAVEREGIAALDPVNGVPFSWNPTRTRGRGVFDMIATADGLWVGSDSDRIGAYEYHARIAFFPLAGGTAVPNPDPAALPVDAYVVDSTASPGDGSTPSRWSFDGDTPGAVEEIEPGTVDWITVRGGFSLDGDLYLGHSDGTLSVRSYDGVTTGPATVLELYGLTNFQGELGQLTGLFYSEGSIFFTLLGDPNLYQRYFTVESGIVGAERFVVGSGGVDWDNAGGTLLSDGGLFWTDTTTGDLHRVAFAGGAPQTGTDEIVSGPASDGRDWRGSAMFALPGAPPNEAPVAAYDASCAGTACSFDASDSADPDGEVVDHAWDFGDGSTGSGAEVEHDYGAAGTYDVVLTVTDNAGATASTAEQVTVVASNIQFIGSAQHQKTSSVSVQTLTLPAGIAPGDQLVLTMSYNSSTVTATDPAGWTRAAVQQANGVTTIVWTRSAAAGAAGTSVSVTTSASVKSSLLAGAYRGAVVAAGGVAVVKETVSRAAHTTPVVTAPAGSWVVSAWTDKTAATTSWTAPGGQQVRQTGAGSGTGHISWLLTDSGGPVATGPAGGLTATASSATASAVMATVVLAPTP